MCQVSYVVEVQVGSSDAIERQAMKERIREELKLNHITIFPSPPTSATLVSGAGARLNTRLLGNVLSKLGLVVVVWGYGLKQPVVYDDQGRFHAGVAATDEVDGHPNRFDIGRSQWINGNVVTLFGHERCTFPLFQAMGGMGSQILGSVHQVFTMEETTVTDRGEKVHNLPATTSKVKQYDDGTVHFIKAMKLITAKGTSAGRMQSLRRGPGGLVRGRAVRHMYDFATQYLRYRKEQLNQTRSSVRLELTSHAPSVEVAIARAERGNLFNFERYARRPGESSGTVEVVVPLHKVPVQPPALPQSLPFFCAQLNNLFPSFVPSSVPRSLGQTNASYFERAYCLSLSLCPSPSLPPSPAPHPPTPLLPPPKPPIPPIGDHSRCVPLSSCRRWSTWSTHCG